MNTKADVSSQQNPKPERIIIIGAVKVDRWLYRSETAKEVEAKIAEAKQYRFPEGFNCDGKRVTWDFFRGYLDALLSYRNMQGTQADGSVRIPMADRPPVLVVAVEDQQVCQLDFYSGHDFLVLDRLCGSRGCVWDVPDFADKPSYGCCLPIFGMVSWHVGSFQTNLVDANEMERSGERHPALAYPEAQ